LEINPIWKKSIEIFKRKNFFIDFSRRKVSIEEGENFARTHGLLFLETSAKTGANVDAAFTKVSDLVLEQIEQGKVDPTNEVKFFQKQKS